LGRRSISASHWKNQLNGRIISIRGSHGENGKEHRILKNKKHTFLLIHDPNNMRRWKGWMIHGHVHNSKMDKYPFINGYRKTINVSVEVIDYKPVSLDALEALHIDSIKWMRTSNSIPERW
jgi:calcineurin-like phosphoesterase family protein